MTARSPPHQGRHTEAGCPLAEPRNSAAQTAASIARAGRRPAGDVRGHSRFRAIDPVAERSERCGDTTPGPVLGGHFGFIALAAAIWLGNRWLLFKQREHLDWFRQPLRKLTMLVVLANVLYTAPITVLGLMAWFYAANLPVDRNALQVVVLTNVIACSL